VPDLMRILETGNNPKRCSNQQFGFSLIEVLVVLVILSVTFGMASLAMPKNEEREWRDLNRRLVVSLNQAKEEVVLSGAPISFQIDQQGWRFSALDQRDRAYFLSDPLEPYQFKKNIRVEGTKEFLINELNSLSPLSFTLTQNEFKATILRRADGYFESE